VPPHLAWLVPVVIDGGIICASVVIWANAQLGQRRELLPFAIVTALVAMSVVVNTAHAADNLLAKVIAALPPLVLLGTLELVASSYRGVRNTHDQAAGTDATPTTAPTALAVPAPATAGVDAIGSAEVAVADAPRPRATPAKKAPAKKGPAKRPAAAKKAPAKKAPAKKAPAKKSEAAPAPAAAAPVAGPAVEPVAPSAPAADAERARPAVDPVLVGAGVGASNGNGNGSRNGGPGAVRRELRIESVPPAN
jgi:hypothetical protein